MYSKSLPSIFATLRARLLVLVCLATLPATFFSLYVANAERDATLRHSETEAKYVLSIISREHINQIDSAKTLLRWLVYQADGGGEREKIEDRAYLAGILAGHPQLANIALLSPNGDVVSSAYPLSAQINMGNYEAIRRALQSREPEAGLYVIGPIVKKPLLHLAQSVRDERGAITGVIFVALDLDYMNTLLKQVDLPQGEVVQILDRERTVLASSDGSKKTLSSSGSVATEMSELNGLQIATSIPHEKIRAEANAAFLRTIISLSLLTLCTVASVVFLEEIALLRYLRHLARSARKFSEGDFSVRVKLPENYGELERLANAFNTMAQTLEERHQELVAAHVEVNELAHHLQLARESERSQIARDLHDEVGQVLTSIKMDLHGFGSECRSASRLICGPEIDAIREKLDKLVAFVRQITSALRPPALDGVGLTKTLQMLARETERNTDLVIDVDSSVEDPLDWLVATTIYRIVQESLTNVIRHAKATEVSVKVTSALDRISVSISDNGIGYKDDSSSKSFGIIGMRERARMIGGTFSIFNNGSGTTVEAVLPVHPKVGKYAYSVS